MFSSAPLWDKTKTYELFPSARASLVGKHVSHRLQMSLFTARLPVKVLKTLNLFKKSQAILKCFIDLRNSVWFTMGSEDQGENKDCWSFSVFNTLTGYRAYSHSENRFWHRLSLRNSGGIHTSLCQALS